MDSNAKLTGCRQTDEVLSYFTRHFRAKMNPVEISIISDPWKDFLSLIVLFEMRTDILQVEKSHKVAELKKERGTDGFTNEFSKTPPVLGGCSAVAKMFQ